MPASASSVFTGAALAARLLRCPLGRPGAHRALPGPAGVLVRIAAADAGRANADGREEPAAGSPRTAVRPLTRRADRAARAGIVLGRGRAASGSAATPAPSRPSQNRPRRCVRVRSRRHQRNRIQVHRHPGLRAAGRRGGRPDRGHDPMFSDDSAFITGETGTADGASMQLNNRGLSRVPEVRRAGSGARRSAPELGPVGRGSHARPWTSMLGTGSRLVSQSSRSDSVPCTAVSALACPVTGGVGARVEVDPPLTRTVGGVQMQGSGQSAGVGLGEQAREELGHELLDPGRGDRSVERPGRREASRPAAAGRPSGGSPIRQPADDATSHPPLAAARERPGGRFGRGGGQDAHGAVQMGRVPAR